MKPLFTIALLAILAVLSSCGRSPSKDDLDVAYGNLSYNDAKTRAAQVLRDKQLELSDLLQKRSIDESSYHEQLSTAMKEFLDKFPDQQIQKVYEIEIENAKRSSILQIEKVQQELGKRLQEGSITFQDYSNQIIDALKGFLAKFPDEQIQAKLDQELAFLAKRDSLKDDPIKLLDFLNKASDVTLDETVK